MRAAMQLLHSLYDSQKNYNRRLWAEMWAASNNGNPLDNLIMESKLSRWHTTGVAAKHCVDNWLTWSEIAKDAMKDSKSTQAVHGIGSAIISLMGEVEIQCDVSWISTFHEAYLKDHFEWLQGTDPNLGLPGFLSFHILLRSFLMDRHLRKLKKHWRTDPTFNDFVTMLNDKDEELVDIMTDKSNAGFVAALDTHTKHWTRWKTELVIWSAFGEWPFSIISARLILGGDEFMEPGGLVPKLPTMISFNSPMQGQLIILEKFRTFLLKDVNINQLRIKLKHFSVSWREDLELVAREGDIWNRNDPTVTQTREKVLDCVAGLQSSSHLTERAVKAAKKASINGRQETKAVQIGVVGSFFQMTSYLDAGGFRENDRGNSLWKGMGRIMSTYRTTQLLHKEMVRLQMQHGNVYVQRREQISKVQKDKSQSHLAEQNTKSMDSYRSNQGRVFVGNAASKKNGGRSHSSH